MARKVRQQAGDLLASDMRIFVALDGARTLTAAAISLQVPLFTVSHAIKRVERLAGMTLIKRDPAGVALTDIGREYLQACRDVLEAQNRAMAVLKAHREEPEGTLRIGAPVMFARSVLSVILPSFQATFPRLFIQLDLYTSEWNQEPTISHDVFLKVRTPQLSRRHLKTFPAIRQGLFASPSYLQAHTTPRQPRDLEKHICVGHSEDGTFPPWNFSRGNELIPLRPRLSVAVDDPEIQARFALAGSGIALLPLWLAESYRVDGRLVPLLEDWIPAPVVFCALHAGRLRIASKENKFLDYLAGKLGTASDPRSQGGDPRAFFE